MVLFLAVALGGCAALPPNDDRTPSRALEPAVESRLGRAVAPQVAGRPAVSGVHALTHGSDAFAARLLLAGAAERSIDAQYYIWHGDQTGLMTFEALWKAANRGVRVRLLVDDQNTKGTEDVLAALGAQPNLEVRLYNPFANRDARALGYLGDFTRLNRRMHNKSFTVDGQAAVVGGRNIGNEYFGAGDAIPFTDLDVVAIGPVVNDVSRQFDLYWNSASAYPVPALLGPPPADARRLLEDRFAAARSDAQSRAYLEVLRATPLLGQLLDRRLAIDWAAARVLHDDPAKTLEPDRTDVLLLSGILGGAGRPKATLDMISPYFVPGDKGAEFLEGLARSGVRVRVLTNSLAATDVGIVHTGYAKRRCDLARAGVRLYELKPTSGDTDRERKDAKAGSSGHASLHAKTYAADGQRIFVGSFNFDPRSALLNTELGILIESPALAGRLAAAFDEAVPAKSYEVRPRSEGGCVEWVERTATGELRHETEPGTTWLRRLWLGFVSLLPIDWML